MGVVALIAISLLIFGLALDNNVRVHAVQVSDPLRILLALIVFAFLFRVVLRSKLKPPPGPGVPEAMRPSKSEIALAYGNMVNTYDGHALKLFINMMIDRSHYLERINERVTINEESPLLQLATRQIFRLGPSDLHTDGNASGDLANRGGRTILIPLVVVEKGTLFDGFSVNDADGNDVATLSYNQTRGLLAYVIETVIKIAPEIMSGSAGEREKVRRRAISDLVTAVCLPGPRNKKKPGEIQEINRLLDAAKELPVPQEWRDRIRSFCETFVNYYVIVAELPAPSGSHIALTYNQQLSVDSSASSLGNRLRSRCGLRYSTFDIPLNTFALEVEAYHLEMDAGPMLYVFDHHLERMSSSVRLTQSDLISGADKPYVRLHYNSAGPVMHVYIRRQSGKPISAGSTRDSTAGRSHGTSDRLKSVVEFREIPPGALGAATVIALMTAAVICFFTLTQIGQNQIRSSNSSLMTGSDIPALVIAFPGLVSLIVGSWLDLAHLRRTSLSAYAGLGASVVLSLASALYFLLDANRVLPGHVALNILGNWRIKTDIGWLILCLLSVTCCLFLVRDVVTESRYYFSRVKDHVLRHTRLSRQ